MSMLEAYIATTRFGFGARVGELEKASENPVGWLKNQLIKSPRYHEPFESLLTTSKIASRADEILRSGRKNMRHVFLKATNDIYLDEIYARTLVAIESPAPFFERLVHFWGNHFAVSSITSEAKSYQMKGYVGVFEREAIRPHITGKFVDMLLAVESHPAMLIYLDNVESKGKNSITGLVKKQTLNENLAREIMELHTLGVGGGYTQKDVRALANIISGWTTDRSPNNRRKGFRFSETLHEPGTKTLLGKRYKQDGEQEGINALTDITHHKSTARFIATKLATHFIADSPSEDSIEHIAKVFSSSDGDLFKTSLAMLDVDEAWLAPSKKVKMPSEFILSAARVTDGEKEEHKKFLLSGLRRLGQYPFNVESPAGYSDQSSDWLGTEAVMRRVEWANEAGEKFESSLAPDMLAEEVLGPVLTEKTHKIIKNANDNQQAMALLFASPEFQMR